MVVLLCLYSSAKLCHWLLEQPSGSKAPLHPRIQWLFGWMEAWLTCSIIQFCHECWSQLQVYSCGIWGGCYAYDRQESTPKRHQLWSNDEALLLRLSLAAGFLSKADLDMFTGEPLVKKTKRADGTTGFSGNRERLKASQQLGGIQP